MKHPQIAKISRLFARLAAVLAILATSLFVSAAPAQSAAGINRYVSLNGTDNTDCSNLETPCRTITYALNQADAGDTLLLSHGVYSEHLTITKNIRIVRNPDLFCPILIGFLPGFPLKPIFSPCPTIDGSDTGRVINVSSPSAVVNLEKIAIRNGAVTNENGAGILNYGDLTLDNVSVYDNAVLAPDYYTDSGGGIANQGTLLVRNSYIYGNSAYDGGGIYSSLGSLTIQNSEIYNNSAVRGGGGISLPYGNAGTIENSTIRGNSAATGGGININDNGHPEWSQEHFLRNVTISGNTATSSTGGLYSTVHVELSHCTLANNAGPVRSELYLDERQWDETDPASPPHSMIYSSIIANTGNTPLCGLSPAAASLFLTGGGNVSSDGSCGFWLGMDLHSTNPQLLPLGNYGGPVMTHALPAGSPAIDFGHLYFNGRDARGVETQDGDLDGEIMGDSGAYEYDPPEVYLPLVTR
ncbi:MAG TPA: right-handed parallel beta-helix repeat-containing protein [Anaerolineaceae bacterium]|nr:right-handed parallel beta-helix repeat-containing protein [Anaerolineaceae bacterium]